MKCHLTWRNAMSSYDASDKFDIVTRNDEWSDDIYTMKARVNNLGLA